MTNEIEMLYQLTMVEIHKIQLCISYGLIIMLMGMVALIYIAIVHQMMKSVHTKSHN